MTKRAPTDTLVLSEGDVAPARANVEEAPAGHRPMADRKPGPRRAAAKHHPAERRRPARRHGTRAGQGLPPPPTSIDGALDRICDRVRLGALRAAFHKQATAAAFRSLSPPGQRAFLAALSFCNDADAVEELVQSEVIREIDPRRAAECLRVARGRGLEYDHSSPEHRARVACGWARRAHRARAQTAAREAMIASGEAYDQEADE